MWFKSHISIYDRDDFLEACRQAPKLPLVWEWVQRESIKQESETVVIKNNLHQTSINNRLQVTGLEFQQSIALLGELELVIYDDYKHITLPDWLLYQGTYFAEKKRKAAWIAEKRATEKQEKKLPVDATSNLRSTPVDESRRIEEIRGDKRRGEEIRVEEKELDLSESASAPASNKKIETVKTEKQPTEGTKVFTAYAESYELRYKIPPVRNAKINALCVQLVKRLGVEDAINVASYYLSSNDAFYVRSGHSLDLLVRDAEKVRTESLTGNRITVQKAREGDKQQSRADFWNQQLQNAREFDEQQAVKGTAK